MTKEGQALFDHLMKPCLGCFARHGIYCEDGLRLRQDYRAAFICGLETLELRRRWMEEMRRASPDEQPMLEARVIAMHRERKR